MNKIIRNVLGKFNIIFSFALVLLVTGNLSGVNCVLAANTSTQSASTAKATSIEVVGKVADTAVTTITFPQGAPLDTISNPYNNVDTDVDPQFLNSSSSEPVVRLKNTSGGTLTITLAIDSWTNDVVASEDYELSDPSTTTTASVASVLSSDGNAATVATEDTVATNAYKALYLETNLSALANVTGTSTLTILGES